MKKFEFKVTLKTEDNINIEGLKRMLASEPESHQGVFLDKIIALKEENGSYEELTENNKTKEKRKNVLHILGTVLNNHRGKKLTEEQIDVLEQYLILSQKEKITDSDIKELIDKTLDADMKVVFQCPELANEYQKLLESNTKIGLGNDD